VTMSDVGRLAGGFHPSTVSLALRNHPGISVVTRKLITRTASKMGYRRDPLLDAFNRHRVSGLAHQAPRVIAFVSDFESKGDMEASARHRLFWKGGSAAARTLRHGLEFFPLAPMGMSSKRLDAVLHARGIRGLVIGALRAETASLNFTWDRYSTVKIECCRLGLPGYAVAAAYLRGGRAAFERMRSLGYRRIGLVTAKDMDVQRSDLLHAGILCEQAKLSIEERVPPLAMKAKHPAHSVSTWLQSYSVDAVLADQATFRRIAVAVGRARARKLGWACLDVTEAAPEAAGIVVDYERMGAVAVEQVVSLMRVHQRCHPSEASTTFVSAGWREGKTLPLKSIL